jgi:hypothetical protein
MPPPDQKPQKKKNNTAKHLAAGLTGAALAAGSYAAMRKFRPSKVPELARLQNQAKDLEFQIATRHPEGRGLRSWLMGAKDVPHNDKVTDQATALLHHNLNPGGRLGAINVNTGQLPDALDDKWLFYRLMTEGTGGGPGLENAVAQTMQLDQALKRVGGDPERLKRLWEPGYVIKPRNGSMSKAEQLLTHATDLKDPRMQHALENAKHFLIQEHLPIDREFRVHMVNNVPVTAAHRYMPHEGLREVWNKHMGGGGGAFVPVTGDERQKLMDFARNATKHLGVDGEGQNLLGVAENIHHGVDIARLADGSYRVIESNPQPGTFMNPIVSRKVQQAITGRVPKDVAALGALGVGGAGLGAVEAFGGNNAEDTREH